MNENLYHKFCVDVLESNKKFAEFKHRKNEIGMLEKQQTFKHINKEIRKHREKIFEFEEEEFYDEYD